MKFGATHATEIGNYKSHAKAHKERGKKKFKLKEKEEKLRALIESFQHLNL